MAIVTTDSKHYSNIAAAIREKTGDETTYTPEEIPAGIDEVYEAGKQAGKQDGMDYMVDTLCPAFAESGSAVTCEPVEGYPLEVVSRIEPVQSGTGDPSPDNIRPISGHSAVKLTRSGKNLLKPQDFYKSAYGYEELILDGRNCIKMSSARDITFENIKFRPDTQYTISISCKCEATPGNTEIYRDCIFAFFYDDGTRVPISSKPSGSGWAVITATSALGKTVSYIGIVSYEYRSVTYIDIDSFQLEEGPTATAYEPFRGETFEIDLGQTVYGGTLNWNTGVLTIDWFYEELDGVEKAFTRRATYGSSGDNYCATMTYQPSSRIQGNILCSHLKNICDVGAGYCYVYGYDSHDIIFNLNGWSALKDANNWLAAQKQKGTPFQVCYELAEPITIQLTPQEIIALSGTNILSSNAGIIEVSGKSNPVAVIRNLEDRLAALEAAVVNNA